MENPQIIIEEVNRNAHNFVIVDEIQKVPELIDAIHWLHENRSLQFALCGSSARKVRKGQDYK